MGQVDNCSTHFTGREMEAQEANVFAFSFRPLDLPLFIPKSLLPGEDIRELTSTKRWLGTRVAPT